MNECEREVELNTRRPAVNLTWFLSMSDQQSKPSSASLALSKDFSIRPDAQICVAIRENGDLIAASVPPTTDLGDDLADRLVVGWRRRRVGEQIA